MRGTGEDRSGHAPPETDAADFTSRSRLFPALRSRYPTRSATLEAALTLVFSPTTRTGREQVATRTAFPLPPQNRNDVTAEASAKAAEYEGMAIPA